MFNHQKIEKKWQDYWLKNKTFRTTENSQQKFYVLDMFPYPSGSGLHVGHPEGYTATDIIARYKRLNGFDVLHPIGWDAFGLPAEQFALKTGNHPASFTTKNINTFRKQLQSLGFSFDYDKEVNTSDPAYFKTTQWIFLQLYKKGLAKREKIAVNWCAKLGTVLANEEVITNPDGSLVSDIGNFPVIKKPMEQWVLKITKYADRLFDDLTAVSWNESLKNLQRNWIKNPDGSLHLQDWIFSRQRYWGEPFPLAFAQDGKEILLIENLPLELPTMSAIKSSGTGESPLANAKDWLYFKHNNKTYRRETNTMPQWAGSCWYYLGYILKNPDGTYLDITSAEAKKRFAKWLPVDLYVGGQEHATLHLLYARFWHKVLYDLKIVSTPEPFHKVVNQGMILGPDNQKMSKSKGNVINPDTIIEKFGADTLRVYEMFMGPLEETKAWSDQSLQGVRRWLDRVYRVFTEIAIIGSPSKLDSQFNLFIKTVTQDIEKLKFNTAISKMMVFINEIYQHQCLSAHQARDFIIVLALFAPHLGEELLHILDEKELAKQVWPKYNATQIKTQKVVMAIQVNGKLRATLTLVGNESKEAIIKAALAIENVQKFLTTPVLKTIYLPGKIVNFVVK